MKNILIAVVFVVISLVATIFNIMYGCDNLGGDCDAFQVAFYSATAISLLVAVFRGFINTLVVAGVVAVSSVVFNYGSFGGMTSIGVLVLTAFVFVIGTAIGMFAFGEDTTDNEWW